MGVGQIGAAVVRHRKVQQAGRRQRGGEVEARLVLGAPPLRQDVDPPLADRQRAALEDVLPLRREALLRHRQPGRRELRGQPVERGCGARRAVAMDAERIVARDIGHQPVTVERIGGLGRRGRHGEPREKDGNGMAQHPATVA